VRVGGKTERVRGGGGIIYKKKVKRESHRRGEGESERGRSGRNASIIRER
jgi:hypothetical protein